MTESMSAKEKLVAGYIPYTLTAIFLAFLLISLSGSLAAALAGGVILIGWIVGLLICQLLIFRIAGTADSRLDFHSGCVAVTFINFFVAPFFFAALLWVASSIISLVT